jgi:hypothetical protein
VTRVEFLEIPSCNDLGDKFTGNVSQPFTSLGNRSTIQETVLAVLWYLFDASMRRLMICKATVNSSIPCSLSGVDGL